MQYQMYIDGQWREALDGGVWEVINPATETRVATVPFGNASDIDPAVRAAARAQPGWAALSPYDRAEILMRTAHMLYTRKDDLAAIITRECGKPIREARAEWNASAQLFEWFAEEGKRAYGRIVPARSTEKRLFVTPMPLGVVGTITSWNFPAFLQARYWAAALAAGCTIVGRPSELTPMSAMALVNILAEAGIPPGVVNLVNGDPVTMGEALVKHPLVNKVCFTGSKRVGQILMRHAAEALRKLSLELGGSAPVIIYEDSDLELAARASVEVKFRNNGQVCISPARFFVHQPVYEDYLEAVQSHVRQLVIGDAIEEHVTNGPMVTAAGLQKVERFVRDGLEKGAMLVHGGKRPAHLAKGYFFEPTILTNIQESMLLASDEVFGPVMPIRAFRTADEAISMANSTPYGLAGYVFTRDLATATHTYEGLRFGVVGVNDLLPTAANAPFGGMKESGFGREMGMEGLHEYLETKFVSIRL